VYGPVLVVPEPAVDERVMTIPGIDGRKMSKSYGKSDPALGHPRGDPPPGLPDRDRPSFPAEPKDPDTIFALYRHLAAPAAADDLARRYREGGVGYAEAKALLAEAIQSLIAPARARHAELMSDPAGLQAILASGAIRARKPAAATLDAVGSATGLGWG
jgi:tryptophanyl-tRNA synthetase